MKLNCCELYNINLSSDLFFFFAIEEELRRIERDLPWAIVCLSSRPGYETNGEVFY